MKNANKFPNKPVIRNINPYFDVNLTVTRGQIMVNVITEPVDFKIDKDTVENVCNILVKNIKED